MRKFLYKSSLFIAIYLLALFLLPLLEENKETSDAFMAAMNDKHMAASKIKKPKIILLGGSNLVFGVNSKQIGEAVGMPIVNMGLHAQLGLEFILNEAKNLIRDNDVVILSMEHLMTLEGNKELQSLAAYYYPESRTYYDKEERGLSFFLEDRHLSFKKIIDRWFGLKELDEVYSRRTFNEEGDGTLHLPKPGLKELGSKEVIKEHKKQEIHALNAFLETVMSQNITLLFSYAPYEQSEYQKNREVLDKIHEAIKEKLKWEIISEPDDFVYPADYFFDSVYHLNKEGRSIHTTRLIEKLKNRYGKKYNKA
ncbi:hypothetical protein HN014_02950 [Aquimarina sp. TRL1]|uniref:hypothetical protein n=1 Tax=Aquimarina sp. (strain TRL1) TaxID=2736252 RepID=UPI00158E7234|nr:hypothetical protein [Aquimarina sp. TRL1]QKX03905.1 hypothetical protein HN014_02950 [Aquimarina sp. TRL1]